MRTGASPNRRVPFGQPHTEEASLTTIDIIRVQVRSIGRRFLANPVAGQLLMLVFAVGAVVSIGIGVESFAESDQVSSETAPSAVKERMFWLTTMMALVFSYSTFETLFRSADHRFLTRLPLRGSAWYRATLIRGSLMHGLLLVPVLAYGWALDAGPLRHYALIWGTLTLVMGIPVSMWLHMLAGASLMGESTVMKRYLGGGLTPAESTFLLYSPVAALAGTMIVGIFNDLFLYESIVTGRVDMAWAPVVWSLVFALLAMRAGARVADDGYFGIMAAFRQAEAPLPYREDGLPQRTGGEGWQVLLPRRARPYFLRDLKQLRRRYRVDKVLLWLYALVLLKLNMEPLDVVSTHLIGLSVIVGLFFVTSFRLLGHELASSWLMFSLPQQRADRWLGHGLAGLVHPLWAWAVTVGFTVWSGDGVDVTWVAGIGLLVLLCFSVLTQILARVAFPERVGWVAISWRLFVLCGIGVVAWQVQ